VIDEAAERKAYNEFMTKIDKEFHEAARAAGLPKGDLQGENLSVALELGNEMIAKRDAYIAQRNGWSPFR